MWMKATRETVRVARSAISRSGSGERRRLLRSVSDAGEGSFKKVLKDSRYLGSLILALGALGSRGLSFPE